MSARCKSCNAPIWWVTTDANGMRLPLNPDPTPAGNVVIRDGLAHVLGRLGESGEDEARYLSHWATCPHSDRHRRTVGPTVRLCELEGGWAVLVLRAGRVHVHYRRFPDRTVARRLATAVESRGVSTAHLGISRYWTPATSEELTAWEGGGR